MCIWMIFQEEDKNLSGEELGKKLDRLLKHSEEQLQKLNSSSKQLRAHVLGQDRYWRRYWELPCAGGIFVEAMESAEPEILDIQAELDVNYKPTEADIEMQKREQEQQKQEQQQEQRQEEVEQVVDTKKELKKELDDENLKQTSTDDKPNPEDIKSVKIKSEEAEVKMEVNEIGCKVEHQNSVGGEELPKIESETKIAVVTESIKSDAKTNVTSEEIKQETEVKNAETGTEEPKNEESYIDEEISGTVVKTMEDKIVETIPNGEKCNHVNNSHYSNGKELNGTFICGEFL